MDARLLLPRQVRRLPADLAAVVLLTLATVVAVLAPVLSETPLRVVLGLPFVLFVPGWAFIAALFPEAGEGPTESDTSQTDDTGAAEEGGRLNRDGGIDGIERVALSFGTSIAIVPLLGLVLNYTPWGIRLVPILVAVGGFTLAMTAVAAVRRWALPAEERFRVPYREWLAAGRAELFEPDSRTDAALNVLLAASIVLAVASVGYAVAVPKPGESFTELYLLTEDDDGELVAAGYPTEFVAGESRSLYVGIGNQEHRTVEYTLVVQLQRVEFLEDRNETRVLEAETLRRFSPRLEHNDTWQRQHAVTPTMTGERLRLIYLLYKGEAPAEPSAETAYREVHLWVNVTNA